MGIFTIYTCDAGFRFDLKDAQGNILVASQEYRGLLSCRKGVDSVIRNTPRARIEDETDGGPGGLLHPKFVIERNDEGLYSFHLKAKNGQSVVSSAQFGSKQDCLDTIAAVRAQIPGVKIIELK